MYSTLSVALFSVVADHVKFISAGKDGHLPTSGALVLAAYYLISTGGRVWAIVVYFTPLLGLFDCLTMAKMGMYSFADGLEHSLREDGTRLSLQTVWTTSSLHLETMSGLMAGSALLVLAAPCLILLLRIVLGTVLVFEALPDLRGFWHFLYSSVCPPLFIDWEDIYLRGEGALTVEQSWTRSKSRICAFVALFALEHLLLCLPLLLLKFSLAKRSQSMLSVPLPLLPEEEASVALVDGLLLGSVLLFALILPLFQLALALIYFRFGHAWSRVLNASKKF